MTLSNVIVLLSLAELLPVNQLTGRPVAINCISWQFDCCNRSTCFLDGKIIIMMIANREMLRQNETLTDLSLFLIAFSFPLSSCDFALSSFQGCTCMEWTLSICITHSMRETVICVVLHRRDNHTE
jgi:hypothetical protein